MTLLFLSLLKGVKDSIEPLFMESFESESSNMYQLHL